MKVGDKVYKYGYNAFYKSVLVEHKIERETPKFWVVGRSKYRKDNLREHVSGYGDQIMPITEENKAIFEKQQQEIEIKTCIYNLYSLGQKSEINCSKELLEHLKAAHGLLKGED